MACILIASGDSFSFSRTGSWLKVLLDFVSVVPPAYSAAVHLIVRKAAHLVEYSLLGLLAYRAFQCTWREWPADRWWVGSLALALACAAADELHQSVVVSRTGSFGDMLVDTTGALLGVYLFQLLTPQPHGSDVTEAESTVLDSRLDA
jgi:VanZ family protein